MCLKSYDYKSTPVTQIENVCLYSNKEGNEKCEHIRYLEEDKYYQY
jgi:hypothetical protein